MSAPPLKFLSLAWFTPVLGLGGLSLAWGRAEPLMGAPAAALSQALAVLALVVFAVLAVLSIRRSVQFPQALAEDLNHPVRHAFLATVPVGLLLLIACGARWFGPQPWLSALWFVVAAAQLWVTWWVLSKWLKPAVTDAAGHTTPMWAGITPVLFVPVVGNVVAPLPGLALGHVDWSVMQASIGLFFWPLVLLLVLARRAAHSVLPDRLLPTWFISVAPPSVLGGCGVSISGANLGDANGVGDGRFLFVVGCACAGARPACWLSHGVLGIIVPVGVAGQLDAGVRGRHGRVWRGERRLDATTLGGGFGTGQRGDFGD